MAVKRKKAVTGRRTGRDKARKAARDSILKLLDTVNTQEDAAELFAEMIRLSAGCLCAAVLGTKRQVQMCNLARASAHIIIDSAVDSYIDKRACT